MSQPELVDKLLRYAAEALDLTPKQSASARDEYLEIGNWLNMPGTLLGPV